jgi:predicted enzyme related to lactoylglutathione lyase
MQVLGPIEYWVIQTMPVDPNGILIRPGVNGGIYRCIRPENKPINYFSVESITDFLDRILKLGAKVTQPKQKILEVGWIAAAEDPEGNAFELLEPIKI